MKRTIFILLNTLVFLGVSISHEVPKPQFHSLDNNPDKSHILRSEVYTQSHVTLALYQAIKDVVEIFEKNKLIYWVDYGTFLGAQRHEGLIPWDDDVDLSIDVAHVEKLRSLGAQFDELGYDLIEDPEKLVGYKVVRRTPLPGRDTPIFVDIFLQELDPGNQKYSLFFEGGRKFFKNSGIFKADLGSLKRYTFGEIKVWGPENHDTTLTRYYGKDWNSRAFSTHAHSSNEHTRKFYSWSLSSPEDRRPGQPTGPLENRVDLTTSHLSNFPSYLVSQGFLSPGAKLVNLDTKKGSDADNKLFQSNGILVQDKSLAKQLVPHKKKESKPIKERLKGISEADGIYSQKALDTLDKKQRSEFLEFLKSQKNGTFVMLSWKNTKRTEFALSLRDNGYCLLTQDLENKWIVGVKKW